MSLENGLGMVKHGFQSKLELFVSGIPTPMRWIVEEVWKMCVDPAKELLCFALIVDEATIEFREPSEDANDNSSGEESWPDPVREEVEEEEDVELPLPTIGVPPLEENNESYPDPWIGVMDMNVTYRNTMVLGVDDDNVPPPVGVGVGQRFMTKDALQMYLKDYCISRHVQFKVHKSGPTVYYVRCIGDQCAWHVYASFSMKMNMWKIRRCNDEHMCLNAELCMDNRLCTSRVICNLIMPNVRTSFTLSLHEIIQLVKDKYHIQVSYSKAWRARNKALVVVFGGWEDSYNLLPQFFKAIKDTNRGTKYKMITTDEDVPRRNFVRLDRAFWAFGPAVHGFQFCRPFISVDGTHLYGKYKGCLLIATSFDGDNRLFPLAFALVEKENIDTWTWFIACLARQVVRGRSPMCIISDRHSSIIRAVADVFPRPHRHRFCIRHIIANLKKRYSVKDLDKMVWRCASAETVAHYDHAIQNLEEVCPGARAELIEDMSPEQWALAYDGNMSFGKLTTNSSESVNSLLKWALSLPVQALASAIFYRMNAWFVHRREKTAQITTHLCPSVGEHKVNVMLKECTCRSFQIYQVSCIHAIAMCGAIHHDFYQMTSEYYYASTNARVYERAFDVPTWRSTWVQEGPVVLPPGEKRTPVFVSNPVIKNGLVKPRLLALQRVPVRGLGVGNVVMVDTPLLYDQDSHRSEAIWHGEDLGCLECTEHFQTLRHWPLDKRMLPYIEAAGFSALHRVQWLRLDKPLITALVETWRSETNTFHLANGEMMITLEDVVVLLGLRVDGDAVTGSTRGDWMELARVLLGVELPPGSFQGGRLSLSWLIGQFSFCPDDATELMIQ
ncbi:hypothetical protein H6P81_006079 [Aristolochia fimbriata]|uniref:SWIM-type domain-containing protein n=1 Tax=Aristolochia fimbriata TaxID=158543 RepID=A0AAV7EYH3_ARIFI|nr:hypothetical protein H6P81_006079 [Aristolochia fimbriata]